MSEKMVRMSFTVPPQIRADFDYLSSRLGVTKSALLTELIGSSLNGLRDLVESVPPSPTKDDLIRARGVSNKLITDRLQAYRRIEGDLFDDRDL